jgi:hypothetical protein
VLLFRKRVFKLSICAFLLFVWIGSRAQERCGTVEYTRQLRSLKAIPSDDKKFEEWLNAKINLGQSGWTQQTQSTYKIPVVVHVIHKGEAVGTGTNISDAQIVSQITVLNEDFTRQNADKTSTPLDFSGVAGNMDIEFVLAKQDPEGMPTNGIVRVKGAKSLWTINDNYELKAQSYWPAEDYLNIWVCDISDYLGYTQFPESSLAGLENSSTNRLTDGVVIWYRTFGSSTHGSFNLDSKYALGRTATHEIGHFFGLRHIWGDDGSSCSGQDYVNDTPNQSGNTTGCPTHPRQTCTVSAMFQNFLDYTDDVCMNLFTQGQVQRMTTVLENSPRRASLLNSSGTLDPTPVANDLGIREITSPSKLECSNLVTPTIVVRNYGNNTVTSATIRYTANGVVKETKTVTLNLSYLQTSAVSFSATTIPSGTHSLNFEVISTNGVTDAVPQNNVETITFSIPEFTTAPFTENFETPPTKWSVDNPDEQTTWELTTAPANYQSNKAMFINFFDYEDRFGEIDIFLSPVFDLSAVPVASLVFDIAHARYQASNDRLKVVVLRQCESVDLGTIVFDKSGAALATTTSVSDAFVPSTESQWRREFVNLNQFIGETHIQIAFVAINDWGNNLFLDDIAVLTSEFEDMSLQRVVSPSLVTCDQSPTPAIVVQNLGTVTINNFKIEYSVNNEPKQVSQVLDVSLGSVGEMNVNLPKLSLQEGSNTIKIEITEPNGDPDQTPSNNLLEFTVMVRKDSEPIPLRQKFDSSFDTWTSVNPTGGMKWETTPTNFQTSLYFNSFNNTKVGDEAWLVSPVLDLSLTNQASLIFDLSKRSRTGKIDELKILGSKDCGNSYEQLPVFFTSNPSTQEWIADDANDWTKNFKVVLNDFAGESHVRLAFVLTNKNGNNTYIDNLEFFASDTPNLLDIESLYSIVGYNASDVNASELKVIFNFPERQTVDYSIVDSMGQTFAHGKLENVLNQTWLLDEEKKLPGGMYIIRMKMGDKMVAKRIIIAP